MHYFVNILSLYEEIMFHVKKKKENDICNGGGCHSSLQCVHMRDQKVSKYTLKRIII